MSANVILILALQATIVLSVAADAKSKDSSYGVESGVVDARKISPYDNAFVLTTYKDGKTRSPGIWTDQLRIRDVGGRSAMVRTQAIGYFDGRHLTSVNAFDPVTFAPIQDVQQNPDGSSEKWTFDGKQVTASLTATPDGTPQTKHVELDSPRFDLNCCMRSIVAAMLPLREGYNVTIASFEGGDGSTDVSFKVVRREKVKAGKLGLIDAWLVETALSGGYIHFWIVDRPPYLVRMTLSRNTVNDYAQSFDMVDPTVNVPPPEPQ
jgi:hypothetical protein